MSDTLYDRDILLWSEQQAATLQRLADGERVNDAIDWPNLIDEVLTVGLSELHACESLLARGIEHLLKLRLSLHDTAAIHWRHETVTFLRDARRHFTPSMRQRIDVDRLYGDAIRDSRRAGTIEPDHPVLSNTDRCPLTLDDLLSEELTVSDLLARFLPT